MSLLTLLIHELIGFLKSHADKLLLLYLIVHLASGITDPAKRADFGQRAADICLGALIGLIQGARLAQRKSDGTSNGTSSEPKGN